MAFSFLWLLSDQMPGQWMKGKLCSFSFTPVGTLPFIKVSVGAGSVPCSVLLEYRPNKDMYSFNVLHWVSPVQSHGTVSSQVALLFSKQFISLCRPWPHVSSSHPLWGQNPGCFSWTGHSQLWGKVNKQDLFINSSLSSRFWVITSNLERESQLSWLFLAYQMFPSDQKWLVSSLYSPTPCWT